MTNFDKIEQSIKENKITPIPKWKFQTKNNLVWFFYFIFLIIGSISFSVILFAVQQTDFVLVDHVGHSALELVLVILPFIWLGILILFIVGSFVSIYNSKKGYKFTFSRLIGLNVGLSIVIGAILFLTGIGGWMENSFTVYSSAYESIQVKKEKLWSIPDSGALSGVILAIEDVDLLIKDFENKEWTIKIDSAFKVPIVKLQPDEKIKILGKKTGENTFRAEKIMPWGGRDNRNRMKDRWNKMESEK